MDFELYDLEINQYLYAIESIIDSYEPVSDYLDIFEETLYCLLCDIENFKQYAYFELDEDEGEYL